MVETIEYDIEYSYTATGIDHLMMAATTVEVDHEINTTDDIRKICAEIGRQNGYTTVKIQSISEHLVEDGSNDDLEPFQID